MRVVVVSVLAALALSTATADAQLEPAPLPTPAAPTPRLTLAPSPPPSCAVAAIEADRAALDRERRAASTWNTAWVITYAAFTGIQIGAALVEFSPGNEFTDATRDSLYIGAGKAAIGSLSRLILPLRVPQVTRSADPCDDAPALARAHRIAARKQRNAFWLQLGGGAALHLVGGGYLVVHHDAWREAVTSLALGAVISTITLYTEPKTSWRHPRGTVTVTPMPTSSGAGLSVVGSF